jgi:hypothetical protein
MYSQLMTIINASDSRYLTPAEQERVLAYVQTVPKRLQAARAVEQKEEEIVNRVIVEMKKRYPTFTALHERAWEKGFRDVQLVLRYIVQGMIVDDAAMPADKLFVWFRSIAAALGMTPGFMRDTYDLLCESCRESLPADAFPLLEPHLRGAAEVLSDFPEPYRPAV